MKYHHFHFPNPYKCPALLYHHSEECEHFAPCHLSEEQVHESLSPIKQLFSIPCLFHLSCKELLENIYMLAQSFSIKQPVG